MEAVKRVGVRIRWFLKDNGAGEQCSGGDVRQACGESSLEAIGQLRQVNVQRMPIVAGGYVSRVLAVLLVACW